MLKGCKVKDQKRSFKPTNAHFSSRPASNIDDKTPLVLARRRTSLAERGVKSPSADWGGSGGIGLKHRSGGVEVAVACVEEIILG